MCFLCVLGLWIMKKIPHIENLFNNNLLNLLVNFIKARRSVAPWGWFAFSFSTPIISFLVVNVCRWVVEGRAINQEKQVLWPANAHVKVTAALPVAAWSLGLLWWWSGKSPSLCSYPVPRFLLLHLKEMTCFLVKAEFSARRKAVGYIDQIWNKGEYWFYWRDLIFLPFFTSGSWLVYACWGCWTHRFWPIWQLAKGLLLVLWEHM